MALRLQIVSRHRQSLGERSIKEFGQNGGTIGRSLESDWVLPDGQRFLSSRHASIDFRSGSYYLIDTSTNGVYVNGANQPVGRGNPQRLFAGDRIRMGEYEMLVEISEMDSTREQLADLAHVDPVDLRQRVDAPEPTGKDLVDAFEITGVGIEVVLDGDEAKTITPLDYKFRSNDLELEEDAAPKSAKSKPKAPAKPAAQPKAAPAAAPQGPKARPQTNASAAPAQAPAAAPATRTAAPAARTAAPAALDTFFRAAGMQPRALDERQSEEIMQRLGQLMREMVVGLTENLHLRAAQKTALRQSNTTIQPLDNNSLKFSAGVDELLSNLFFRESEQYLNAVESVREAFGDLKRHQQVLMKAMQMAVSDYIARLDPEPLEEKFSNGRHGLLGAANKLKYWDLYKDLYQVVAQQHPGELPQLFLEEISRAYEAEATRTAPASKPALKVKAGAA
jgi:type VI secretion system protein